MNEIFDVVVVGGGPSGIGAAIAVGRLGMSVALIEKHPFLGGMGTAGLVNNFCNAHFDGERYIIGGIFGEIRQELIRRGALFVTNHLEPYNHHVFRELAEELCRANGVQLYLDQHQIDCTFQAGEPSRITLDDFVIAARTVVDSTGDAVVAKGAGVSFIQRSPTRGPMPLTYCYIMGPVDLDRARREMPETIFHDVLTQNEYLYLGPQPRLRQWVKEARTAGELTIPRDRIAVAYSIPGMPEMISVNFGRVAVDDPADPAQLAEAEKIGRQQVEEGERFFRKYVPGFENATVTELARQIGVRESRQILGKYCLTGTDVLACQQFDDVIAQCCYSVDIHEPASDRTTMIALPKGGHYDIPLRCLVPQEGPKNLIVAGRSICATQEAMSSFRVSPSVMAIGQAAGVTAAIAAKTGCDIDNVPYARVRSCLQEQGAVLS